MASHADDSGRPYRALAGDSTRGMRPRGTDWSRAGARTAIRIARGLR